MLRAKISIIGGESMKRILKLTSLVLIILVCCGSERFFAATNDVDLIFLNGTGESITEIEIHSKENKNVCAISDVLVEDQKVIGIDLPTHMENLKQFQVIIKYGTRIAKTKKIEISGKVNNIPSRYLLTIQGKDSTIPIAAGAIAGGATTAGVAATGTAIVSGAAWATALFNLSGAGAGALTGVLAWIGSAFGGGMALGVATVSAVPIAIGAGAFGLSYLLQSDTLLLTRVEIE